LAARRKEPTNSAAPQLSFGFEPVGAPSSRPAAKDVERLPFNRLTVAELDAMIQELEKKIAPTQISRLRRARAAKIAGKLSGPGRIRGDAASITARWRDLVGSPGAIKTIAGEFGCSVRTVHRKLGKSEIRARV
jgi:hypothetical protein